MKKLLFRALTLVCAVCALFGNALALSGDTEAFTEAFLERNGFFDEGINSPKDFAQANGVFYALMSDDIVYRWAPGEDAPAALHTLPAFPWFSAEKYSAVSETAKAALREVATGLLPLGEGVGCFNVFSGKIGEFSESGINWRPVTLDTSLLMEDDNPFGTQLAQPFAKDGKLYGQYDRTVFDKVSGESDIERIVLVFDLETGACEPLSTQSADCLGWYTPESALLMHGSATEKPALSVMDLATGEIRALPLSIPVQNTDIGGLAYDAVSDAIFFFADNRVWRSVAGAAFESVADIPLQYFTPYSRAWVLPDGRYALESGGLYIREMP